MHEKVTEPPNATDQMHRNEKNCQHSRSVLDIEHRTFTPLVLTTTDGMGQECLRYRSQLAELIALTKGEQCVIKDDLLPLQSKTVIYTIENRPQMCEFPG